MNNMGLAICIAAALLLSCDRTCTASNEAAPSAKVLIDYPGVICCYEDGRVEFQTWKIRPGSRPFPPNLQMVVANTGQLEAEQLQQVIDAVDAYLANPAPFVYGDLGATDQRFDFIDIRHGRKIRRTCVYAAPVPPALADLFGKIREPLASMKLESDDTERRDQILAEFKPPDHPLPPPPPIWLRGLTIIPNDEPDKLISSLFDALTTNKPRTLTFLGFLADIHDPTFGDAIHASLLTHREALSKEQQSSALVIAMRGGSLRAIADYPTVEHSPVKLYESLQRILSRDELKILASRIGVRAFGPPSATTAWRWLAENTDALRFDPATHQYHIIGMGHPLMATNRAKALPTVAAQSQQQPLLIAGYWAIAALVAWLAAIQIGRSMRARR